MAVTPGNCKACTRASDNAYSDCPPRMADGRIFTDYRPRCDLNYSIPGSSDRTMMGSSSYTYRQYLIQNADQLMAGQRAWIYGSAVCGPCVRPYDVGTMLPEQTVVKCDARVCTRETNDPSGLGQGRVYGATPDAAAARSAFLERKESEQRALSKAGNCCASPDDLAEYFGHGPVAGSPRRTAVPFGGQPPR